MGFKNKYQVKENKHIEQKENVKAVQVSERNKKITKKADLKHRHKLSMWKLTIRAYFLNL